MDNVIQQIQQLKYDEKKSDFIKDKTMTKMNKELFHTIQNDFLVSTAYCCRCVLHPRLRALFHKVENRLNDEGTITKTFISQQLKAKTNET
jgi:hypothetical protein